jgi:hypothetical protein
MLAFSFSELLFIPFSTMDLIETISNAGFVA